MVVKGGNMIKRLFYLIGFVCGGFLFAIPKWLLMGTKGGRERKALLKEQKKTNQLLKTQVN